LNYEQGALSLNTRHSTSSHILKPRLFPAAVEANMFQLYHISRETEREREIAKWYKLKYGSPLDFSSKAMFAKLGPLTPIIQPARLYKTK
jgi:hypothetical protein